MMVVDHVTMAVSHRVVTMKVGMWLGSFPDFMFMLVMFVVRVQVRMVHGLVTMIEFTDIASRPQHCPRYGRTQNKYGESGKCRR